MRVTTYCVLGLVACGSGKRTALDGPLHDGAAIDVMRGKDAAGVCAS